MLRFLDCLQNEHDWRLVLLAAAVCFLTSFAGLSTFQRAGGKGRPSPAWLLTAGVMTGCGIWATHFIAVLAFTPGFEGFRIGMTIVSLLVAAAMVTAGFAVAMLRDRPMFGIAGGFIVGAAIAAMHYTGIAALDMPTVVGWSAAQFTASILIGQGFAVASLVTVGRTQSLARVIASGALLALAIVSHHFISMSAMTVVVDSSNDVAAQASRVTLSIAITLVMAALIVACLLSAFFDRRARRRLAERNMQLDAALNNMSQGLCLFDADGRLRLCNPRFLAIYGLTPKTAFVGATIDDLTRARRAAGTLFRQTDDGAGPPEQQEASNLTVELVDGRTIRIISSALPDGGWVATHSDITRRLQDEARIAHLAHHDPLTGLANRSAFDQRLDDAIHEAVGTASTFAIICIDLDQFKRVNDLFGHGVGDELLHAVAGRLRIAAHGAFLARLASDEFTIISAGKQPETAEDICARISAAFETAFTVRDIAIASNCSIGVSVYPQDATDAQTLRMHADVALRRAKTRENGAVCFFEPAMDEQIRARRALQRDLAAAIAAGELELYYQPQATAKGDIIGFEVLLRWLDRTRGFVPPDVFIPVAEEMGMIGAIDAWVLRNACRQAASWQHPLPIAVNLSAASFASGGDVERLIEAALAESGLAASRLEIEITESVLFDDFGGVRAALHRIRALGVRIAMDDFGKGYSSLSYLQSFPFDKLKIDRAFISADDTNATSALIVTAIIGLGHTLKLKVLAEGVETEAQRDFLIESGCDELQGYLLGRPKPIGHYRALTHREDTAPLAVAV